MNAIQIYVRLYYVQQESSRWQIESMDDNGTNGTGISEEDLPLFSTAAANQSVNRRCSELGLALFLQYVSCQMIQPNIAEIHTEINECRIKQMPMIVVKHAELVRHPFQAGSQYRPRDNVNPFPVALNAPIHIQSNGNICCRRVYQGICNRIKPLVGRTIINIIQIIWG